MLIPYYRYGPQNSNSRLRFSILEGPGVEEGGRLLEFTIRSRVVHHLV